MTIQEYVAEQTVRVAVSLAHFLQTTQEDKRDWLPETTTRSATQQAGECVGVNRFMAKLISGEEVLASSLHDYAFESAEDAQNQLVESANLLANAIRAMPEESLERVYQHPRGQIVGRNLIIMPLRNMAYHAGQINFIQTLYGDTEFHVPPTWR